MLRNIDFSSWQAVVSTLLGVVLIALIGIGIRLVVMMTIQQRRERMNRQINERLKVLIAAYKTLGGSFTGRLTVDPRHMRDLRRAEAEAEAADQVADLPPNTERTRQIRDAVEAALSDILLLGTEDQVRLAARAAGDLVEGREIRTSELVVSLRDFIRRALDLDPVPDALILPQQGPARPGSGGGRGGAKGESGSGGGKSGGGGGGMGGGGGGMGMGMGLGAGAAAGAATAGDAIGESGADPTGDDPLGEDPFDPLGKSL